LSKAGRKLQSDDKVKITGTKEEHRREPERSDYRTETNSITIVPPSPCTCSIFTGAGTSAEIHERPLFATSTRSMRFAAKLPAGTFTFSFAATVKRWSYR
jgi:hypothetical protein